MPSLWSDRIESHEAIRLVDELSAEIDRAPEANPNTTPEALSYLRRAQRVLGYFRARLRSTEPALIPLPLLDRVVPHMQSAKAEIQAFVSDNNVDHLRNVDRSMDGLLSDVPAFPPLPFSKEATVAAQAAESYSNRLLDMEGDVRNKLGSLVNEIETASTRFDQSIQAAEQSLQRVTTAAEASASDIATQTEAKLAEVRAEIDGQKRRLDDAIAQMQSTFSEAQERRINDFAQSQETREAAFLERTEALTQKVQAQFQALTAQAETSVKVLQEREAEAARVLGVVAASKVAGAYLEEADQQRHQADKWRIGALLAVGLLLMYAIIIAAFSRPGSDLSLTQWITYSIVRYPIGVIIGAPFFYLHKQSAAHRRREQIARRLGVELTAFRPFLAELNEEERKKLIAEAQYRFFPGYNVPSAGPEERG